jgi:hypothetical protein
MDRQNGFVSYRMNYTREENREAFIVHVIDSNFSTEGGGNDGRNRVGSRVNFNKTGVQE